MRNSILIPILGIVIFFASCSSNQTTTDEAAESTTVDPQAIEQPIDALTGGESADAVQPVDGGATPSAAAASGQRLNPPHGEPGHVCEIPVGEPLPADGKVPASQPVQVSGGNPGGITVSPAPSGAPAPTPQPAPTTISTQPTAGSTPPGMNPPHGEPGHDCAIPVGAPLKK
jgi:hypothetical protein